MTLADRQGANLVSTDPDLGLVLVTIDSEANGLALARQLVESHLAACVSLTPIQSIYRWQGQVQAEPEWQLVIKTNLTRLAQISQLITQHHPYDLPEIIALPIIAGLTSYLSWVRQATEETCNPADFP
ncbi:MAG: divalent-cation tolerance protein CutA [Nodosilinea sp.]